MKVKVELWQTNGNTKGGQSECWANQDTGRRLVCLFIYLKCPTSRPTTCHRLDL